MGFVFSKIFSKLFGNKDIRILILGKILNNKYLDLLEIFLK